MTDCHELHCQLKQNAVRTFNVFLILQFKITPDILNDIMVH